MTHAYETTVEALLAETRWLHAVARGLVTDDAAADDLVQEVVSEALHRPPSVRAGGLRGWLRTVARRRAGHANRRRRLQADAEQRAARSDAAVSVSESWSHDRAVLHEKLAAAIAALPRSDRDLVVWTYFDERSAEWISSELGVSPGAVRTRRSRALAKLRKQLDTSEGGRERWAPALTALAWPSYAARDAHTAAPAAALVALAASTKVAIAVGAAIVIGAATWALLAAGDGRSPTPDPTTIARPVAPDVERLAGHEATPESAPRRAVDAGSSPSDARYDPASEAAGPPLLRIVDESGAPVPDAGAAWVDIDVRVHPLEIEPEGDAELPTGLTLDLFVAAPGFIAAHRTLGPLGNGDAVDVVLPPARTIRGLVRVDGGRPPVGLSFLGWLDLAAHGLRDSLGSATQRLRGAGALPAWAYLRPDAEGRFECTVEVDSARQSFWIAEAFSIEAVAVDGAAIESPGTKLDLPVGADDVEIDLRLLPAVTGRFVWAGTEEPLDGEFRFRVVDRDGSATGGSVSAVLMSDGRFWVPAERAESEGSPLERGHAVHLDVYHPESDRGFRFVEKLADVSFPHDVGNVEVPRLVRRRIRVLGRGPSGVAPLDAWVAGRDSSARTDAGGYVDLPVHPEDHLDVFAPDFAFIRAQVDDLVTGVDGALLIELPAAPKVRVDAAGLRRGADARMAARVRVRFEGSSPYGTGLTPEQRPGYDHGHHRAFYGFTRGFQTLVQMSNGYVDYYVPSERSLSLYGLRPGADVRIELIDGLDQLLADRRVTIPGEDLTVELEAGPTARVICLVESIDGRPVDARVAISADDRRRAWLRTESGRLDVGPLAVGTYTVNVRASDDRSGRLEAVSIGPGDNELRVVVE
ncbi:MAG: sigma-70 family RNA polymerase sigma factor [Planctomycetota bacterium]